MKKMGKIVALLLAMVMVFGMSVSVLAAGTKTADGKVTVSGLEDGDTVNLYQVIKWVTNDGWTFAAPYDTGLTNEQKTAVLAGNITSQLAETIAELHASATVVGPDTAVSGKVEMTVDPGLYLVLVTPADSGFIYNPAFVASDYDENETNAIDLSAVGYSDTTYVKKTTITVEKTVDSAKETDAYSLGDDLSFTIATTIPNYPANSSNATLKITDAPTGLTIDPDTVVVKVGDDVVYDKDTPMAAATGTANATAATITVDFAKAYILANGGKAVTVTYTAELTSVNAVYGTAENNAKVEYNPNPFVNTTREVGDKDLIKTYGFVFEKVDDSDEALADAVFDLYDAEGNKLTTEDGYFRTVTTTIADGHAYVYWAGLKAGTYTVKETTAPAGYIKAADFTVTVGPETATADNPATADVTETNYKADLVGENAIVNVAGVALPSTGGIGTTIFYIVGAILVIGAGVLLVTRRRMNLKQQ